MADEDPRSPEPVPLPAAPQDSLRLGQTLGSFRIVRKIGEGGMGTVYAAVHVQIGYRAAIKVLHPEYARHPEVVRRFLNEARAVNIVQDPGVVKIFEFGNLPDKTAYIIMEYLDGEVLSRRLHRAGGKLPAPEVLRLARQIASALAAAHSRKVIHRDLKPANIMLMPDPAAEGRERAKLLDFGLAKVAEGYRDSAPKHPTRTGVVLGTAMYMSPEQCRGARDVDGKADVYSLGIVLFEMLCGRPPFLAESEGELVTMQLRDPPPLLRSLEPSVPEEVAALVHRMLAKEPADRPDMQAVCTEIERLIGAAAPSGSLATQPQSTLKVPPQEPPSLYTRWRSFGLGLLAVLVSGLVLWLALRADHQQVLRARGTWTRQPPVTERHLRAVWTLPPDVAWAVGDHGVILRYAGGGWSPVPSEPTLGLRAVWGSSPSDVWIAGNAGAILHWSSMAWRKQPEVTTAGLRGIWGSGPRDVWAVGEQGTTLHFDGERWATVPSGVDDELRAVFCLPEAQGPSRAVWAVGDYGVILRWDGTAWTRMESGTKSRLAKVWGLAADHLWAAGNDGTILHYNGREWRRQPSGVSGELSAIYGHGPRSVWVAGNDGVILHFDGTAWLRAPSGTQKWLYGLWAGPGQDELWAVGKDGVILRYHP
jgi:serine/threonine protein kinase